MTSITGITVIDSKLEFYHMYSEGEADVKSEKYNNDENYRKPLNEVSKEIQRRKDAFKASCKNEPHLARS